MGISVKVIVKHSACCRYGICADICPDIYKLDENGIVYLDSEVVPPELVELAKQGAAPCPQSALETQLVMA